MLHKVLICSDPLPRCHAACGPPLALGRGAGGAPACRHPPCPPPAAAADNIWRGSPKSPHPPRMLAPSIPRGLRPDSGKGKKYGKCHIFGEMPKNRLQFASTSDKNWRFQQIKGENDVISRGRNRQTKCLKYFEFEVAKENESKYIKPDIGWITNMSDTKKNIIHATSVYPDKTTGSETASNIRSEANSWPEEKRSQLFDKGMQIIYGGNRSTEKVRTR